jgi:hypothetical protein
MDMVLIEMVFLVMFMFNDRGRREVNLSSGDPSPGVIFEKSLLTDGH